MWIVRGRSWTVATTKMERFVIIVNGWKPLTIITKPSILDAAAALDPPLDSFNASSKQFQKDLYSNSLYIVDITCHFL